MRPLRRKAFAYITWRQRLLVFRHVDQPIAGIQVPAGTIEPGEAPAAAALREAREETGLAGLALACFLGEQLRDMAEYGKNERHQRYFYHLLCTDQPPITWRREEPDAAEATETPPLFEFFWVALPDHVPPLIADHGALLPVLVARLAQTSDHDHD